jgi:hypothetical protein
VSTVWLSAVIWVVGALLVFYFSRWSTSAWFSDETQVSMTAVFWPFMPLVILCVLVYRGLLAAMRGLDRFMMFYVLARVLERTATGVLYETNLTTVRQGFGEVRRSRIRHFVVVQDPTTKRTYRHPLPQRTNGWTVESALAWMAGLPPGEPYEPQWEG